MGLLDDAIKEHLELKRRRGAPEDELARQEAEALGPVRRNEDPLPQAAATAAPPAPAVEDAWEDLPPSEPAPPVGPALLDEPVPGPAVPPAPPLQPGVVTPAETAAAPEPPLAPPAPPAPEPSLLADEAQATREFSATDLADATNVVPDEVVPADADADVEDHDVLDDTPDFLQETPEHDRLWFEQKPPKDFDF